ncbi:Adenosine receptor A2a [Acipenser ruthenus]|uniref:Adenosine receptor A2 n=1 Tax=Acipenser ruthenus TaxID=7906 RepID=A0A444V403_ACIRT|nr:Adenosine receptor A2a [Acipenser ruthenus]
MLDADVIYIILELVIAVLAVLGNVLVCWAVCLNSNLQNVTNFFVVSLAVADIAVGVLAIPFAITISTGFCAHFHGCLFIACFVLVLTQSSIFSLLAIAIDRYIAIKIPLRYNGLVTGQRAKGIIAICWVLSVIIGLTPMLGWNKCTSEATNSSTQVNPIKCTDDRMMPCLCENVVTMDYMVYFNFFAFVLVPLLLMLGIYLRIFMAARHQLQLIELKAIQGEKCRSILQKEVHAAKSLAIIVGLFAVCWLPLHIINCFTYFCPQCPRPPAWLMYLAIILSHGNSVVNPFIYAYRIREFRQTFRKIIRRHILAKKEHLFKSGGSNSTRTSVHTSMAENSTVKINGYALNMYTEENASKHCNEQKTPGENPAEQNLNKNKPLSDLHQYGQHLDLPHMQDLRQQNRDLPETFQNGDKPKLDKNAEVLYLQENEEFSKVHVNSVYQEKSSQCPGLTEVS